MIDRPSVAALGVVVAGLALAALAHQQQARRVPLQPRPHPMAQAQASSTRALRDGEALELNTATAADLEMLPGIGPALAGRIVESRATSGPFLAVDELQRVRGIGPRTLQRLRTLVGVSAGSVGQGSQADRGPARLPVEHPDGRNR
jgi:competence protein ComEA